MVAYVNYQTSELKFTALHYAAYHGDVEICEMLLAHGADQLLTNKYGLNVLHMAAQGDAPITLYYFHCVRGMPLDGEDGRKSTPLHWAVFSKSELGLLYLLAWTSPEQLAKQDQDGMTALHLAVKRIETSRVVKALLYRGAPIDTRDKDGKTALDHANEIESITLKPQVLSYM